MKTSLIIYGIVTGVFLIARMLIKEGRFKKFDAYWYYPLVPFLLVFMVGYVGRDLWRRDKVIFVCCSVLFTILVLTLIFWI